MNLTVLSVRQPFCSLLLTLGPDAPFPLKACENRSWSVPYRGRLWLHASRMERDGPEYLKELGYPDLPCPVGVIQGSVELVDCLSLDAGERASDADDGTLPDEFFEHWTEDAYAWLVRDPQQLSRPIPTGGRLRLWTYQADPQDVVGLVTVMAPGHSAEPLPDVKTKAVSILVDGVFETVNYCCESGKVDMWFRRRQIRRKAVGPDHAKYRKGDPCFRAACERAWKFFPEVFTGTLLPH